MNRLLFASVLIVTFLLFPPFAGAQPWHQHFVTLFLSVLLAAVPYLIIGALAGALIERFLPARVLPAVARRLGWAGVPIVAAGSAVVPVCECGVVAIGRGLLGKGLPLPHVVAYLLAGPILNPTVLLATWSAFGGDWRYPLLRALGGLLVAIFVALVVARWVRPTRALLPGALPHEEPPAPPDLGAALKNTALARKAPAPPTAKLPATLAAPAPLRPASPTVVTAWSTMRSLADSVLRHFLDMGAFFVLGVFLASGLAVWKPFDLTALGTGPVSGPAAMMGTAFLLSLCAEADAFIANSITFAGFSLPALIAFLVFGPMFDIKLLLMYRTVFRNWFIALLAGAILVGCCLYVAALTWLNLAA